MGLCEGCPSSVMPDHMGRADYHGDCINQAARFMDAGAGGGVSLAGEGGPAPGGTHHQTLSTLFLFHG